MAGYNKMRFIKSISVAILFSFFHTSNASIFTISDDRIRSLDITPVLGRGYSIMTNQFHSTCLVVDQTTVPSFNYDCEFELELTITVYFRLIIVTENCHLTLAHHLCACHH